jgi:dipeptidyl aminopeptidase/acylaminoacyl peptidase
MPIIGEGDMEPNDCFVNQLTMNARAAVDAVVNQLKVADPDRICVGGHSYGAFMTAHLLAHTEGLFRAGLCRSGAYNRSLTPFGFQYEQRSYWEALETYHTMSPFSYAELLAEKQAPLLFVHGEDDPNSGTQVQQSERMFAGIKGNGGTARLVILPKEQHGYAARQSILHTLYETDRWLEKYNQPRSAEERQAALTKAEEAAARFKSASAKANL